MAVTEQEVKQIKDYLNRNIREKTIATNYKPPNSQEIRWLFDYSRLIWELRSKLYGGYLTENQKGEYLIKISENATPFMNDGGIEDTISIVNAFVSGQIQALSFLTEERILEMGKDLYIKLAKLYYVNMELYELSPAKASIVLRIIMNLFETNLRKSLGGQSLRLIGETEKVVATQNLTDNKSIWKRLLPI